MKMLVKAALALALLLAASGARAEATLYELRQGSLTYRVVHKLHEVAGVSKALEGRAKVEADGPARVQVRVRVDSFDSGNANRDAHMREVTHAAEHPYAELRGQLTGLQLPASGAVEAELTGTVELNGVRVPVRAPVKLSREAEVIRATFQLALTLTGFQIERPALLFVPVDDALKVDGELLFAKLVARETPR